MRLLPRRRKRHRPGILPRHSHPGHHPLLHLFLLPALCQNDHQRRHCRSRLQRGLSAARAFPSAVPGSRCKDAKAQGLGMYSDFFSSGDAFYAQLTTLFGIAAGILLWYSLYQRWRIWKTFLSFALFPLLLWIVFGTLDITIT